MKNQYITEIRTKELISYFFDVVWDLLGVGWSPSPFDLSPWDFRNLHLDVWEPTASGLPLLAANLLWKGLTLCPSLVRTWYTECKDRSLNIAVEKYVAELTVDILTSILRIY